MNKNLYCIDCALKLFNKKCCNLGGIGNPNNGIMIVVPNVDYVSYKYKSLEFSDYIEVIKSILSSTGGIEQVYIVPLIRCRINNKFPPTKYIIHKCMKYTFDEIRYYNIKKVMLLGDAAKDMKFDIRNSKDKIYFIGGIGYSTNYSPFVKFKDDKKYDEFRNRLIKWISANKYNNYNGMQIIRNDT